ncbi:MAG: DUF3798 domain-containing protein, partial [Deltaproteobacteria bacterium]|nr:DUF3798 domain-containing protein [Deltaproteobacteria bacterium]
MAAVVLVATIFYFSLEKRSLAETGPNETNSSSSNDASAQPTPTAAGADSNQQNAAAAARTEAENDQAAPFHIGVVTGNMEQGAEDLIGAEEMVRRYGTVEQGGLILHRAYPNEYFNTPEKLSDLIASLAEDPLLKVIVVNQSIPGTSEGFRKVKEKRPDIFCLAGEPHESSDVISLYADLVVASDYVSRGYLLPYSAKQLGADTLVHVSFERHMSYDHMRLRALIMEHASKDLGLKFVMETAPDPTKEAGIDGAREYIVKIFPDWLSKYGEKTVFFATNDAHTEPLIKQIANLGGFFVEADIPSPLLGFPDAFDLELTPYLGQWPQVLKIVEDAVIENGGDKRIGTWAYPLGFTQTAGLVEFGKL